MSRPDIGKSTVHRLLTKSAGGSRVADEAAEAVLAALMVYIQSAGEKAQERLKIAKRKTVTEADAVEVFSSACLGIGRGSLRYNKLATRGIPVAGAERVFKSAMNKDSRTSDAVKGIIAAAAEAFVAAIGSRAKQVTDLVTKGTRNTIKARDVNAALAGAGL